MSPATTTTLLVLAAFIWEIIVARNAAPPVRTVVPAGFAGLAKVTEPPLLAAGISRLPWKSFRAMILTDTGAAVPDPPQATRADAASIDIDAVKAQRVMNFMSPPGEKHVKKGGRNTGNLTAGQGGCRAMGWPNLELPNR